jgi:glycosyltransferase involved in cell wall biosynthesis
MKILIFNWQDIRNPQGGGAEVHLHQIFSRIVRQGHSVTLYCSAFGNAPHEEMIDGISVIREGGRYMFNYRVPLRYYSRFRKEKFDIVIDDMNKIPFFTPLYVKKPLYFIIHHLFGKSIFHEASFPFALYVYCMEKLGVAVCRKKKIPLMVVSPSTREEMINHGFPNDSMEYAYNCVDHNVHRANIFPKSRTPLIGYFGRLKKYKSIDHLLQAFSRVKKRIPNIKLVIVGDGDHRPALQKIADQLEISASVQFTGYVSEEEKVEWLNRVWFMVNTSSKEGWGLTVIESNACGTTVIGSDVPGLRDAIKDGQTGLLYPYGYVESLSEKIQLLINDRQLRERLSKNAIEWASTFNWDVVAEKVVSYLRQEIENHQR